MQGSFVYKNIPQELFRNPSVDDRSGLKITIDLKRGADPEKLMKKVVKMTTIEEMKRLNHSERPNRNMKFLQQNPSYSKY